jgi:hypothetical protein
VGNFEQDLWNKVLLYSSGAYERIDRALAMMNQDDPIVLLVDDDHRMREALSSLVEAMGF